MSSPDRHHGHDLDGHGHPGGDGHPQGPDHHGHDHAHGHGVAGLLAAVFALLGQPAAGLAAVTLTAGLTATARMYLVRRET